MLKNKNLKKYFRNPFEAGAAIGAGAVLVGLFAQLLLPASVSAHESHPNSHGERPRYLRVVTTPPAGEASSGQLSPYQQVYQLNNIKSVVYEKNLKLFEHNLRAEFPIIISLFSSKGGRMILYKPGSSAPIEAPSVPATYGIAKSVGHSTLALYSLVIPYADKEVGLPLKLREQLKSYLKDNRVALKGLRKMKIKREALLSMEEVLRHNIKFLERFEQDKKLVKVSLEELNRYTKTQAPHLKAVMNYVSDVQVGHWARVLGDWKSELGEELWAKTYGVANAVFVTRRRNVLFSIMAQFFRKEALQDRLFLFETTEFDIGPEALLRELTRVVSDRAIGDLFWGGKFEMDIELLGKATYGAILRHRHLFPGPVILPPLVHTDQTGKFPW